MWLAWPARSAVLHDPHTKGWSCSRTTSVARSGMPVPCAVPRPRPQASKGISAHRPDDERPPERGHPKVARERRSPAQGRATPKTNHHHEVEYTQFTASECRCGYDEYCVCEFYFDWIVWESAPQTTPAQLKRRCAAALRMTPAEWSGRRDPISARLGRWHR